ncbi:hypothetical protein HDV01_001972 [Terramyces sp. JEL0728]|nr:hypothetical protein HDV01_001972 [Terramyces sp. JEL0728]
MRGKLLQGGMNIKDCHYSISSNNPNRPLLCPEPVKINDSLVIRRATLQDKDEMIAFNSLVHGSEVLFGRVTETYFTAINDAPNPAFDYNCMTVVVDTSTNKIVSSCSSVPQLFVYGQENKREMVVGDGSELKVGDVCPRVPIIVTRPEAIGTLPEYRGQQLINVHLDIHNKWALELGAVLQIIGGIPGYYHRFGYENGMPREIKHVGYRANLETIETAPEFQFRLATTSDEDVEFIDRVARIGAIKRLSIWTEVDKIGWKNIIGGRIKGAFGYRPVFIIEKDSLKVGFIVMSAYEDSCVIKFELDEPKNTDYASWTDVTLSLMKWLPKYHLEYFLPILKEQSPKRYEKKQSETELSPEWSFKFELGYNHPCLSAVSQALLPKKPSPNFSWKADWYTRIQDRLKFLQTIQPVLNYRLQSSPFEAITRKLLVAPVFRSKKNNILIDIVNGKITSVELVEEAKNAVLIPSDLFTIIVLGTRKFSEVVQERGDVYSPDELNGQIFDVLFPKMVNDQVLGMD